MSDIEEDVRRCEKLTEPQNANWIGLTNQLAIAGVLAERKQDKARIQELQDMLKEKDKEIEKKDKIIYEMLRSFADIGFGFDYCNNDDRCINDCDKCLMQYFERKAKDGRN